MNLDGLWAVAPDQADGCLQVRPGQRRQFARCRAAVWPALLSSCHGGAPMLTSLGLVAAPVAPPPRAPAAPPTKTPTGPPTNPIVAPDAAPVAAPPSARSGSREPQAASRPTDSIAAIATVLRIVHSLRMVQDRFTTRHGTVRWQNPASARVFQRDRDNRPSTSRPMVHARSFGARSLGARALAIVSRRRWRRRVRRVARRRRRGCIGRWPWRRRSNRLIAGDLVAM